MKPIFEPSAVDFLDALRSDLDFRELFNHILDEVNQLAIDPAVDGRDKFVFPVSHSSESSYRILWGRPVRGRSFWYVYEPDYTASTLNVFNMGDAGVDPPPFLSRR